MASSYEFYTALQNSAPSLAVDWLMHALLAILWQVSHFWSHIQQFYMPYTYITAISQGANVSHGQGPSSPAGCYRPERHPLKI